jgi:Domain of unknown function (DUF4375)
MTELEWLDGYAGQTTEELLALRSTHRIDSLVLAFEQALDRKAGREGPESLREEERVVLAVEALEREVNNGGFLQFFDNSSQEFAPVIVGALRRIGCPRNADIARRAVAALALDDAERNDALEACDQEYYRCDEDIAGRLFDFIAANRGKITP